ncbi:MAG TPA: alpha/beta hydrolase [Actinomycetota bacterium]|nr:alpha/beta hydrolase [Actinomycetota bacterium]
MPAVLVHGVPDTSRIWEPVLPHLGREDVLTPSLPGFGCPRPDGFDATKESYLGWLVSELEAAGEPVDLVGHDWGALLTLRLVCVRPDLVRTWAAASAVLSPHGNWHGVAKIWQTPIEGEAFMKMWAALPEAAAVEMMVAAGVPEEHARTQFSDIDDRMLSSVLDLYRSAERVFEEWSEDMASVTRPGLLLAGAADPVMKLSLAQAESERIDVPIEVFEGGHWFPLEDPQGFADTLQEHWARV